MTVTKSQFEQIVERVRVATVEKRNAILALREWRAKVEKFDVAVGDDGALDRGEEFLLRELGNVKKVVRSELLEAIDADIRRHESEHRRLVAAEARRLVGEVYGTSPTEARFSNEGAAQPLSDWASFVLKQALSKAGEGIGEGVSEAAKNRVLSLFGSLRHRPTSLDVSFRARRGGGVMGTWECRNGEWNVVLFVHEDGSAIASGIGSGDFLVSFEVGASDSVEGLAHWLNALANTPPSGLKALREIREREEKA